LTKKVCQDIPATTALLRNSLTEQKGDYKFKYLQREAVTCLGQVVGVLDL